MRRHWLNFGIAALAITQTACRLELGTQLGKHEFHQTIALGSDQSDAPQLARHGARDRSWAMGEQVAVAQNPAPASDPVMSSGLTGAERTGAASPWAGLIGVDFVELKEVSLPLAANTQHSRRSLAAETSSDPMRSHYSVGEVGWSERVGSAFSSYLPRSASAPNAARSVAQANGRVPANRSELRVARVANIERGSSTLGTELPYVPQGAWANAPVNVAAPGGNGSSRRTSPFPATSSVNAPGSGNAWESSSISPTGYLEPATPVNTGPVNADTETESLCTSSTSARSLPIDAGHAANEAGAANRVVKIEPIPPTVTRAPIDERSPQEESRSKISHVGHTSEDSPLASSRRIPAIEASSPLMPAVEQELVQESIEATHSLEELIGIANSNHPAIAEANAQIQAAQGLWTQAGLGPNPLVGFSGQQLASNGQAEQIGLLIEQRFLRGGKLSLDQMVAAREVGQARQRLTQAALSVEGNVRRAYVKAVVAQRRLQLAEELVAMAEENLRLTQLLVDSREASQVELLRARSQTQSIRAELEAANRQWQGALASLEATVGNSLSSSDVPIVLDDRFPTGELPPLDETLADRLIGHPALAEAQLKVDQARWRIQRECAELYSDIDVQMVFQYDEAVDAPNGILQVTGPLMIRNRNQGNIRAARAQMVEASRAVERKQLELEQAFAMRVADYEEARGRVQRFTEPEGILESSRQASELMRLGVQAGEQDLLQLFLSERDRLTAELEYLDALEKALDIQADLETLMLSGK